MGINNSDFVKERNAAFVAFVMHDDWEPVRAYCQTYGVSMPENPDVMAAGIYKAVQEIRTMPDEVKRTAAMKCLKLGFTPFMQYTQEGKS